MAPLKKNPRYYAVAHRLTTLPVELVQKILSDIEITKIIDMVTLHNIPYLENCIISHPDLQKVLHVEALQEVKERFAFFAMLLQRWTANQLHKPCIQELDMDIHAFIREHNQAISLSEYIEEGIFSLLRRRYTPYVPALRTYTAGYIEDTDYWVPQCIPFPKVIELVACLDEAEVNLNEIKSQQLERMARLLQENPNMLKPARDGSQEVRRNQDHIIQPLLRQAEKMKRLQILNGKIVARSIFARKGFYLVPYDRYLRLFIKVLVKYPPSVHEYPEALQTVLAGLFQTNLHGPLTAPANKTNRISFKPNIKKNIELNKIWENFKISKHIAQTQFTLANHARQPIQDHATNILPADEEEFTWLEAFMEICRYMKEMAGEWKPGVTVREYWHSHAD